MKAPAENEAANGESIVPGAVVPDEVVIVPVNVFCPKKTPLPVERLTMMVTVPCVVPLKAPVKQSPKVSTVIPNPSTVLVLRTVGGPVGEKVLPWAVEHADVCA